MTQPGPGMDHGLYPFSAMPERAPLHWPGDKPLAGVVFLYLEHWELMPPTDARRDPRFRDPFGDFRPDYRTYTWREYGNRVGIFRLMEVLDRLHLPVTVVANAGACERYGYLVEQLVGRGYEFAAHGLHATRMLTSALSEDEERDFIASSIDAVTRATGIRPTGWLGQDYSQSTRTPRLLAEASIAYLADWPNDDQPYWMSAGAGILSLPNQSEWDDVQLMWHRRLLSPRFPGIIAAAAERLAEEAVASGSGRFMGLHLHPWLSGMPHRFPHVARGLEIFAATPGLWAANAGDVARHAVTQLPRTSPTHTGSSAT